MERFRGYRVRVERIVVGGRPVEVLAPFDCEALLSDPQVEARFALDKYMPYWATLWPGALLLADAVAAWGPMEPDAQPPSVLELGGGLGLVGLVAARLGYPVTVSDYDEDALAFVRESARRSGLQALTTRYLDWRTTHDDLRVDRIVAADVLYEARNLQPIAAFISQHLKPDGFALISDANRSTADPFEEIARSAGLSVEVAQVERAGEGNKPVQGRIFHLRDDRALVR